LVAPLGDTFRAEWGRVLATLIGVLGDFDLAEDAAQEAFAIAARSRRPTDPRPACGSSTDSVWTTSATCIRPAPNCYAGSGGPTRRASPTGARLGRTHEARVAYRRARDLTDDGAERRFLERRLTELAD
jgi:predicted RNA polymerase sigma factor